MIYYFLHNRTRTLQNMNPSPRHDSTFVFQRRNMDTKNNQKEPRQHRKYSQEYSFTEPAWNIAHTLLWPEQPFSEDETEHAKRYIQSYFDQSANRQLAFSAFCERIILTQKYLSASPSRFVPNPSVWFNPLYQYGFAGTKSWYLSVQKKRDEIPGYLQQYQHHGQLLSQIQHEPFCQSIP
jgi:hypothetical protein